jgi:hypothetical protein
MLECQIFRGSGPGARGPRSGFPRGIKEIGMRVARDTRLRSGFRREIKEMGTFERRHPHVPRIRIRSLTSGKVPFGWNFGNPKSTTLPGKRTGARLGAVPSPHPLKRTGGARTGGNTGTPDVADPRGGRRWAYRFQPMEPARSPRGGARASSIPPSRMGLALGRRFGDL